MKIKDILLKIKNKNALAYSQQVQKTIYENMHFGYDKIDDIIQDLENELDELKQEISKNNKNNNIQRIFEELGDVFFVLCNLSNYYNINPTEALDYSTNEYIRRITACEKNYSGDIAQISAEDMLVLWKQAKLHK